ncbi:MAG: glycosyl hydrolase [Chthoniobacteraceae bacterium]
MNGTWFPWSGFWYGGGTPIPGTNPVQYEGPENFKKAYRYVVDRCRKDGATNILWVFHAMNTSYPYEAWNDFTQYYPGSKYIDWIGFSVYRAAVHRGQLDSLQAPALLELHGEGKDLRRPLRTAS